MNIRPLRLIASVLFTLALFLSVGLVSLTLPSVNDTVIGWLEPAPQAELQQPVEPSIVKSTFPTLIQGGGMLLTQAKPDRWIAVRPSAPAVISTRYIQPASGGPAHFEVRVAFKPRDYVSLIR